MATTPRTSVHREVEYPTSDGRPIAETDLHRRDMMDLITTLEDRYADDPEVYVTGNLLLFYEEGDNRKHVSPDVFMVRGVPKLPPRENYKVWEEGKGPDVVIEITSKTTWEEDEEKLILYRDVLKVPEYFQFDPTEDYLKPPMQGHRLVRRRYAPIKPVEGRLPSVVLGLHLEHRGTELRLYDPATGRCLLTRGERAAEAVAARRREAAARRREAAARRAAEGRAEQAEAEVERLRQQIEELKRKASGGA